MFPDVLAETVNSKDQATVPNRHARTPALGKRMVIPP